MAQSTISPWSATASISSSRACGLELGDHHRVLGRDRLGAGQDAAQLVRLVGDAHGRAGEHVARAHQHREAAEPLHDALGIGGVGDVLPARLVDAQLVEQGAELVPVLGHVDALGAGAEDADARRGAGAWPGCWAPARPCDTTTP